MDRSRSILWFMVMLLCIYLVAAEIGEGSFCDASLGECNSDSLMPSEVSRRILAGYGSYISYGALSANRVPCPPRSGRSYYTPNCNRATGRANPYHRSCSRITRCQRASW